jgi:hypothetical protein
MKRLRFDQPSSHVLIENGERIHGGGEFFATDERALELLTDPHVRIVEAVKTAKLERLGRSKLDALARERGVAEPETLPNKAAVIAAISEPGASPGGGHESGPEEDS